MSVRLFSVGCAIIVVHKSIISMNVKCKVINEVL